MSYKKQIGGFTLVELLVVFCVICILVSLLLPVLSNSKHTVYRTNEINSSKQLIIGWQMYAEDHDGKVLPGYRNGFAAYDNTGSILRHPINARYPWRLIPWLGDSFELIYANKNRKLLNEFKKDLDNYNYAISLFPSLGINSRFVGGDDVDLAPTNKAFDKFGPFCIKTISETNRSSELGVFFSSRHKFGKRLVDGFYLVKSPYFGKREWELNHDLSKPPSDYGYVHHRYKGKSVVAHVDGHSSTQDFANTLNMKMWCNIADKKNWILKKRITNE